MSDGSNVVTLDSLDEATRTANTSTLELNEDGSLVFRHQGADMKGTWTSTSAAKIKLDFEDTEDFVDISYDATLEDGTLAIADGSYVMLLEKAE